MDLRIEAGAGQFEGLEATRSWLTTQPSLDDVAARLRFLRAAQQEITQAVAALERHVVVQIGEPDHPALQAMTLVVDDEGEPF